MKPSTLTRILPCTVFFTAGRAISGCAALLMQVTIILWPFAARWAANEVERAGVERLLNELSAAHHQQNGPYPYPAKKFRQPVS